MKFLALCLLLASNCLAAPDKTKRDAEYFGQFQLPEVHSYDDGQYHHAHHHQSDFAVVRQEQPFHDEYHVPHEEYNVPHEEYNVPHKEYNVPHEEYGLPRELPPTTTPHYCPEEDFKSAFIPSPPHIESYPLPEVPVYRAPVIHEEYGVPHEEYNVPHTTTTQPPPPPRTYPYPAPTTTTTTTQPPPPPRTYPYPAPTTTTTTQPPPPPRTYPYPAPTTTTTTTTQPPPVVRELYPVKVYSKYEHVHAPVVRFVKPKIVVHKKIITVPLFKKKYFKFF